MFHVTGNAPVIAALAGVLVFQVAKTFSKKRKDK
jgi:hypothetical protein